MPYCQHGQFFSWLVNFAPHTFLHVLISMKVGYKYAIKRSKSLEAKSDESGG